jgi:hypothetical protein
VHRGHAVTNDDERFAHQQFPLDLNDFENTAPLRLSRAVAGKSNLTPPR